MSKMIVQLCSVKTYLPIKKLKLHPQNPRRIDPDRLRELKNSIIEKGFYQPILVWKKGGIILSGNHRFMAVSELINEGYEFSAPDGTNGVLPVVIEDVSPETAEAILYESNNNYAEWVEERLANALKEAKEAGRNIEGFGFDKEWVDVLLKSALAEAAESPDREREKEFDYEGAAGVLGEVEEFESLILPKPVYDSVCELLAEVARGLNKEWSGGDSYAEAMQALCQFAREKGIESLWQAPKVSSIIRRSKASRLEATER